MTTLNPEEFGSRLSKLTDRIVSHFIEYRPGKYARSSGAVAVLAVLFALAMPGMNADAKTIKYRTHDNWKLSCNTARHMVRERGYNPVKVKSCITSPYAFWAVRKGRTYIVRVDQRTGFVWQE